MKPIFLFLFILVAFFAYSKDVSSDIDEKWVTTRLNARKPWSDSLNKTKLTEVDSFFIDTVATKDIKSIEPAVASYLRKILFENDKSNDLTNIRNALDILVNKFEDKTFFLDYSSSLVGYKASSNPFVLKKIIEGLRKCTESSQEKIFKNFDSYYRIISVFLSDKQKYGSDYVIPEFILFLREYIRLVNEQKIKDTERKKIINIVDNMGLSDKKRSDFQRYPGGEELKQEYFYYNQSAFEK
ncbi:MAG TPA: hypothetical protein PLO89_09585 [Spirochaetota bacterium]|nr:hypothetical protein [Spirochaetota bacterium]